MARERCGIQGRDRLRGGRVTDARRRVVRRVWDAASCDASGGRGSPVAHEAPNSIRRGAGGARGGRRAAPAATMARRAVSTADAALGARLILRAPTSIAVCGMPHREARWSKDKRGVVATAGAAPRCEVGRGAGPDLH
jgi:hypothetical protein